MATEIAKAYVQLIPSAKGIKGSIENTLSSEVSSAGSSLGGLLGGNLVKTLGGIVAAAGIGKMIQSSILEGANLQQSLGGVETLFKDSADKVILNAKNAYITAGMSANEYMETVTGFSASLLQSLAGDTEQAAAKADMALLDMSDNANKFGTSMELIKNAYSGFAKQNYTMLDNLKLGYGGTRTEMERLLKDAQKISGIEYNIDSLADVYDAIHVIQDELGIAGTTALEASKTFSGSFSAMKAAASNFLGALSLGEDVGPTLEALTETTITFLADNLLPMVGNIFKSLPIVIGTAIKYSIPKMKALGKELISNFSRGLKNNIISAYSSFNSTINNILNLITERLPGFLSVGVNLLTNIANGIFSAMPSLIKIASDLVLSFTKFIFDNYPVILKAGADLIMNIVNGIAENLPKMGESAVNAIGNFIDYLVEEGPSIYEQGKNIIVNLAQGLIDKLPDIAWSAIEIIGKLIATLIEKWPDIFTAGKDIIISMISGIGEMLSSVVEKMAEIGQAIVDEIAKVDLLQTGKDILDSLLDGFEEVWENIKSFVTDIGTWIIDEISKINLLDAGKAIMDSLLSGLTDAWTGVTDFVGGIGTWISEHKGPIEYDRKLLIPHGRAIMKSLNQGLRERYKDVQSTVLGTSGMIQNALNDALNNTYPGGLVASVSLDSSINDDLANLTAERLSVFDRLLTTSEIHLKDDSSDKNFMFDMILEIAEKLGLLIKKDTNAYIDKKKISRELDDPLIKQRKIRELTNTRIKGEW